MFEPLINSTTAFDDEMNYNFYHVAKGTILPRGNSYLEATTGTYDIGSTTYPWASVYVNNVHVNSSTSYTGTCLLWIKLTEVYLSMTRLEITGLNGDRFYTLDIITRLNSDTASTMYMYFNGDSTATHYAKVNMQNSLTALYGTATTAAPICGYVGGVDTVSSSYSVSQWMTKAGTVRRGVMYRMDNAYDTTVQKLSIATTWWSNTSSTITSIVLEVVTTTMGADTFAGTYIGIWGRG